MNKRLIIFIIIGVLILLGISGALFWAVKKQKAAVVPKPLGIVKILDESVISPAIAYNNNSVWYFNAEGRLFSINTDGSNLSEFTMPAISGSLKKALWPKDGPDFITVTGNGTSEIKNYFNSKAKIFTNLPANIQSLDWMPDGKRVVYVWLTGGGKSQQLVLADADGTGFKKISDLFWPDLAVKAGNDGKTVLMYRTNAAGDTNKVYAVNLNTGEISTILSYGKNIAASWLSSGNKFLFAQSSTATYPKIFLYDMDSNHATDLGLNTILDKIVSDASGKYLYAAVPKKDNSGDTFVKIDLGSLANQSYFDPSSEVRVRNIMLAGNSVFYTDNRDGKLYTIGN
jgi:hypothetical protein